MEMENGVAQRRVARKIFGGGISVENLGAPRKWHFFCLFVKNAKIYIILQVKNDVWGHT